MGSTGFSEESLRGKLAKLTNQQDSIQTLTAWILHHHEHHQAIVQSWHKVGFLNLKIIEICRR